MKTYSKSIVVAAVVALFMVPVLADAATLTSAQANAIIGLLQAFGASEAVVLNVEQALGIAPAPTVAPANHVSVAGSVYRASNLGYDLSFATKDYPANYFSFSVVGVTRGKAFTQNTRMASEFSWARFGAQSPPTIYMNLNAPYGSTVAGHVSSPKDCPVTTTSTMTDGLPDPTVCAGYNYGYNAAQSAYQYATAQGVTAPLWWLDIEEANSWSPDPAVNDATIQGAIDYLNTQNIRVGIYSVPNMWYTIAGTNFSPTQSLGGRVVTTPNWLPVGITDQIGAGNDCITENGFIAGSPIWLVQYEDSSTAIDQNYAC